MNGNCKSLYGSDGKPRVQQTEGNEGIVSSARGKVLYVNTGGKTYTVEHKRGYTGKVTNFTTGSVVTFSGKYQRARTLFLSGVQLKHPPN